MRTTEELKEKVRVEKDRCKFSTHSETDKYLRDKLSADWFKNWATMFKGDEK